MRLLKELDLRWKIWWLRQRVDQEVEVDRTVMPRVRFLEESMCQEVTEYQWSYVEKRWSRMKDLRWQIGVRDAGGVVLKRALLQCYLTELERLG